MIKSYKDLEIWKKALNLAVDCYQLTKDFPKEEMFGLAIQIKRSAVSVPSNIAEGRSRIHPKEFIQFLSLSRGSLAELETQLEISQRLGFSNSEKYLKLFCAITHITKMLNATLTTLRTKLNPLVPNP